MKTRVVLVLAALTNLLCAGCDDGVTERDATTEPDAGARDAGLVDADAPGADSPDAGLADAGLADAGLADAGAPCEPGDSRLAACGRCGMRTERCAADGTWDASDPCLGQGDCLAGDVETETGAMCLGRSRTCDAECFWGLWEETRPAGECEPDDTRTLTDGCPATQMRTQLCSSACVWLDDRPCRHACAGVTRTSPWYAEERCVAAGLFVRGSTGHPATQPVADVYVSNFYIDRYPVTNARYAACVTAGVCPPPIDKGAADLADPTKAHHPVHQIGWIAADEFCRWDGRRLPTEAEWEKAARGPHPRMVNYPWGTLQCSSIQLGPCGYRPEASAVGFTPDPVDAHPATASYYGIELLMGGVREWVWDYYSSSYYSDPSSLSDPSGPASAVGRTFRGIPREYLLSYPLYVRGGLSPTSRHPLYGFRCARDGD